MLLNSLRRAFGAALPLACALLLPSTAHADRWFGSVSVTCGTFGLCGVFPQMPDPPGDPASLYLERTDRANAPLEIVVRVNKPIPGGTQIRFVFGDTVFDLQPGTDVKPYRHVFGSTLFQVGYSVAPERAPDVLSVMRRVSSGHMTIEIGGKPQERLILLDGLDDALRWLDERQGRAGAQDAIIDKGPREAADVSVPRPLIPRDHWPKEIEQIFTQHKCENRLATFGELAEGFIATPAPNRELWQIPCAGGNYNILFIVIELRNYDLKTARALTFPTRLHKRSNSVVTNPVWWEARKELWVFRRGHSHGDCGTVALYSWGERGFTLVNERTKDDCDWKFDDPWTKWPVTKAGHTRK